MTREEFVGRFGGVFEHSPWVAERAWDKGLISEPLTARNVQMALSTVFREASHDERLAVLQAHPDLAGRLALADELTAESRSEQSGAGLDQLTEDELKEFTDLNRRYLETNGFPFIVAVRGHDKNSILVQFEHRITLPVEEEFSVACSQVERIAAHRIADLLPDGTMRGDV